MTLFIEKINELAKKFNVNKDTLIYKYIEKKTKASGRGSKARRSLGNLYALYVLCNTYNNGLKDGSSFTELMNQMKKLPFGAKLQNHPLDNRLNDEIRRSFQVKDSMLPVQDTSDTSTKKRKISVELLSENGMVPESSSLFITRSIELYISEIDEKQNEFLLEIESANDSKSILEFIEHSYNKKSDARLFEVVSFSILSIFYSEQTVKINDHENKFQLFKTGRTNANDGGIDFVLKPVGRFFQVTEVLDFRKYFLDFDKINKFPITFVVKTELTPEEMLDNIKENSLKSMNKELSKKYMSLFEEVFTIPTLRKIVETISHSPDMIVRLREVIIENFKLEYGLLD